MSNDKHSKSSTTRGASTTQEANYFDLSVRSLPGPPFLFLTFAAPSNNAHEPPRSTP
ncbi:hypothetical protein ACHAQJ_007346 [Trichoderma viride]